MTNADPGRTGPETSKVFINLEQSGQKPSGDGDAPAPAQLPAAPQARSGPGMVSGGVIVAGLVIALGLGAIFGMRMVSKLVDTVQALAQVQFDPDQKSKEEDARMRKVMLELDRSSRPVQVVDPLRRDPFARLNTGDDIVSIPVDTEDPEAVARAREEAERRAREAARRRALDEMTRAVESEIAELKVQGLIGGRVPVARINGEAVRVGDRVGEHFVVESIDGRQVVVFAASIDRRWRLRIGLAPEEITED